MDHIYRAIGRFMVEFSQLQHMIEYMTVISVTQDEDKESWARAWAVLSGRTAQPVVNAFFSLCVEIKQDEWSSDDFALLKSVRKEIQHIIEERNRIAHDVWSLGHPNYPVPEGSDALRFKYSVSTRQGALRAATPITVAELDELSDDANRLRVIISYIGLLLRPISSADGQDGAESAASDNSPSGWFILNEDGQVIRKIDQES
jgi:hypothetical protein